MKKKIAIVGSNGLPGRYGGWDQLVNHLTLNLNFEFDFYVYTSKINTDTTIEYVNNSKIEYVNFKANGFQSIPYDIVSLFRAAKMCDVILVLGTSGAISFPIIRFFKKKIILNPDGLEWKRNKWSFIVKIFLLFSEAIGILFSNTIIADNKHLQSYILKKYRRNSVLIEYGGDNARNINLSELAKIKYNISEKSYAFKVCRIEPENNIDLILSAFSVLNFPIILIGNWDNSNFGKKLRQRFINYSNIKMVNPIYNQIELDELRSNAGIYIHGHSVGGTNPSLVEAMHLNLLIFAFNVPYNIETTEKKALYFSNSNELIELVNNYLNNSINYSLISEDLKLIAKNRYTWNDITNKYAKTFS